jgi:hypothetical protein
LYTGTTISTAVPADGRGRGRSATSAETGDGDTSSCMP